MIPDFFLQYVRMNKRFKLKYQISKQYQ